MNDEIDADDFKIIKDECNEKLRKLEARLADLPAKSSELRSIEGLLDCLVEKFTNVLQHYRNSDIEAKRHLISSMYPQNLCFDKNGYRTFYLNEHLRLILLINSRLEGIKKGEKLRFCDFSPKVDYRKKDPNRFFEHLKMLCGNTGISKYLQTVDKHEGSERKILQAFLSRPL